MIIFSMMSYCFYHLGTDFSSQISVMNITFMIEWEKDKSLRGNYKKMQNKNF